jgi:transposase
MTVVKIIANTRDFYLFQNITQLISYAGLDVVENQSGKHNGKIWISKKRKR